MRGCEGAAAPGAARGRAVSARRRAARADRRARRAAANWRCVCCAAPSNECAQCCCRSELPHLIGSGRPGAAAMRCSASWWPGRVAQGRRIEAAWCSRRSRRTRRRPRRCGRPSRRCCRGRDAATPCGQAAGGQFEAHRPGDRRAAVAAPRSYRCGECGFAGRKFYWHCPGLPGLGQFRAVCSSLNCAEIRYHFPMMQTRTQAVKTCVFPVAGPRHAVPSGHQGESEGDAADRRQAADPIRGRTRRCPPAPRRWCSSPAAPSGPSRITSTAIPSSRRCCRRRASRNCWNVAAASCRAGRPACTYASRRRSAWGTPCCARGPWSATRRSWFISLTI